MSDRREGTSGADQRLEAIEAAPLDQITVDVSESCADVHAVTGAPGWRAAAMHPCSRCLSTDRPHADPGLNLKCEGVTAALAQAIAR